MSTRSDQLQKRVDEYREISRVDTVGRRVFATSAFDGILTMLGVVMGSFVANVNDPRIILATGFSTGLAMGISGLWGSYMTETAERKHEMHELERAMLTNMKDTRHSRASQFAVLSLAALDGLSPLLAGAIVLIPFFFTSLLSSITTAYIIALAVALVALFGLGVFLARISRDNILKSGVQMIVAGIVCVVMSFFLGSI